MRAPVTKGLASQDRFDTQALRRAGHLSRAKALTFLSASEVDSVDKWLFQSLRSICKKAIEARHVGLRI